MLAGWRHAYANLALTGSNLLFLLIALRSPTPAGIGLVAGLVGATSFYAWYVNLRRHSAVADTPTSRISSAPQGYVELVGKGVHPMGSRLVSPISGLPCLWYRYITEEKIGGKWHQLDSGVSTETFGINDGSGAALIDPDGAEIITSNKQVTVKGHYRHTEWNLIEGEILYVLGEHVTFGGSRTNPDLHRDVSDLLTEWKRDKAGLLKRFDPDGDGSISLQEWELARSAARKQVEREHRENRLGSDVHLVRKPSGRLYLIANRTPEHLASGYRFWAWAHLSFAMAACMIIASLL